MFTSEEIRFLSQLSVLSPQARREVKSYLEFLVAMQCRYELRSRLLCNSWLYGSLLGLFNLPESSENYCQEVKERVRRLKQMCFAVYEQIAEKYEELLGEIKGYEDVVDSLLLGLRQIEDAARAENVARTRKEIVEMMETYKKLTGACRSSKVRAI